MNYRELIIKQFGEKAFNHALFYEHDNALRFELSTGGKFIDQFITAYKKAEQLANVALTDTKSVYVCLSFYAGTTFLSALSKFKNIKGCQIDIPKNHIAWYEQEIEEDPEWCENPESYVLNRHFIVFECDPSLVSILLWGALGQDLGIKPCPKTDIYIFSIEQGVIIHPYDDRGMDIVSTNNNLLKSLYTKFNHFLLDYGRTKMESTVGAL